MSQEDLEARAKVVSQSAISRMERGRSVDNPGPVGLFPAMLLARILGSTVEELFGSDLESWKREREAWKLAREAKRAANNTDPEAA